MKMDPKLSNLELLKFVSDMGEREQDRLWQAFSHMLTLNGGLFVLLGLSKAGSFHNNYLKIIAIAGALVCLGSIFVVRRAKYDAKRWQADAAHIIENDEWLKDYITARTEPREGPSPKPRASEIIRILLGILAILWVYFLFVI